jgi:O-antigen chain-terminating methyltransferase
MLSKKSPLLYPLRIFAHLVRLPRYIEFFEKREQHLTHENHDLGIEIESIKQTLADVRSDLSLLPSIDARIVNLQYKLEAEPIGRNRKHVDKGTPVNYTVSDNHDFDYFYKLFEDRFRGTEEAIKKRMAEHLPLFMKLPHHLKKLPIIDIGCGRGEFLSLMKEHKLQAIGVDMNKRMVDRANALGYTAVENDALTYLQTRKTNSLAAIVGFHIVEHIPFESLLKIFEQCYRTVTSGGFVLFETPNPQALVVGANTFYLDPSHQRPIPPPLLAFMIESVGFKPKVIPLHRVKPKLENTDPSLIEVYETLYGPGDYAVMGQKI